MFNHWKKNTTPYSWNPKKIQTKWSGTDNVDRFKQNPDFAKWQDIDITYDFSNEGFRTYDFDSLMGKEIDVALGCSHTMGVGLPIDWIWPSLVEKNRPYPMLNLGLGAGTSDTVARILTNITGLFQINTVFIFWPNFRRFEIYKDERADFIIPNHSELYHIWNMNPDISLQRFHKNKLIVELLHDRVESIVGPVYSDVKSEVKKQLTGYDILDHARDGMHFGPETHKLVAKLLLEKLTNIE
jgi:hypothetical protein